MLTISMHMLLQPSSSPNSIDNSSISSTDKCIDDHVLSTMNTPVLAVDNNIMLPPLLTARCCFGIVCTDDKIYVIGKLEWILSICYAIIRCSGGYNRGDCLDTIEQYDFKQGKWNLMSTSAMTSRRGRVSATMIDNRIYVCGGSNGQKELNTGEYFDVQTMKKWSTIKELSVPVAHCGE
jgi:hypothetical protein